MQKNVSAVIVLVAAATIVGVTMVAAQGPTPRGTRPRAASANAGTGFTYQGQLKKNGAPVTNSCALTFNLWDAASAGTLLAGPVTATPNPVSVANGLFTVQVDFGANVITGDARWVEIAVLCTGDGSPTTLARQPLTPAPMALALPGLFTQQNGTSPNLIGGYSGNSVTPGVVGATIGGGGQNGSIHRVFDNFGTIGGGMSNTVGLDNGSLSTEGFATIGGGGVNTASSNSATVSGGWGNTASGFASTIGGGFYNTASNNSATVGGGDGNAASGFGATVPGGINNSAAMTYTLAAGRRAKANHPGAFVWGDSTNADFTSTGNDQFLIRANGGVGINTNVTANASLQVAKDISFWGNYGQIEATGATTPTMRLTLGFDSAHNLGWIQASQTSVADRPLVLNPDGGYVGIGVTNPQDTLHVAGTLRVDTFPGGTNTPLCFTGTQQVSNCSSSLRYKTHIADLALGLDTLARLRPVTFDWKQTGEADLGLVAEEVNQVTPLLVTRNKEGEIEGVKYNTLTAVLVKGMQQQQQEIADLRSQVTALKQQNETIEARLAALEQSGRASPPVSGSTAAGLPAPLWAILGLVGYGALQKLRRR